MSHFTTVKTKIRSLQCLKRALKDMNFEFSEAEEGDKVHVKGYQGETTKGALSIHASRTYDIGVQVGEDGSCEFVADWWGVESTRGVKEDEFIKKLTQRYSYHKVLEEIQNKGYTLESEELQEGETIQLRVRTWGD